MLTAGGGHVIQADASRFKSQAFFQKPLMKEWSLNHMGAPGPVDSPSHSENHIGPIGITAVSPAASFVPASCWNCKSFAVTTGFFVSKLWDANLNQGPKTA